MLSLVDYSVEAIADSIAPDGTRLTTLACTYPRFVHAEVMTHRQFSRNAASSRAIPVRRRLKMVSDNPVMPIEWGANKPGMQASEFITPELELKARAAWITARDACILAAADLDQLNVHKQIANRLVEPWSWITVLITSTEWSNFFGLRCDAMAQPELHHEADLMRDEYLLAHYDDPSPEFIHTAHLVETELERSRPRYLTTGDWHLPYITEAEYYQFTLFNVRKLSVARCARISYLNFDGARDPAKDLGLHDGLRDAGHWSCFEHVAQALSYDRNFWPRDLGNFRGGWLQYRKMFANECR